VVVVAVVDTGREKKPNNLGMFDRDVMFTFVLYRMTPVERNSKRSLVLSIQELLHHSFFFLLLTQENNRGGTFSIKKIRNNTKT